MSLNLIWPYLLTGLTVAVLHASLPTHWLPFVLAGRSQKWGFPKTLSVLFIAGMGHIVTTSALGAGLVWFGLRFTEEHHYYLVLVSSLIVFFYGVFHLVQYFRGHKHSHCDHVHPHHHDYQKSSKDGWAVLGLLALLTFSPCESFIPVYLSAWQTGWTGFISLTLVLGVGTLFSMFVLTSIAYFGLNHIKLRWLEEYEKLFMGGILIILSVMIYFFEKTHQHI